MYAANFSKKQTFQKSNQNFSRGRQEKLKSRAEKNLAIMEEIKSLIGDDITWASEEEMIKELSEMRRQKLRS